jgi:hypothetical protein
MAASSALSTFLDVTQAAGSESAGERDVRTKVLAVVLSGGGERATSLAEQTKLSLGETLSALGWLESNDLVHLRTEDGDICVTLTAWATELMHQQDVSAQSTQEEPAQTQPAQAQS